MEKKIYVAFILLSLFWLSACGQDNFDKKLNSLYKKTVPLIHADELVIEENKKEKVLLFDTRSRKEFNVSHIRDAHFLNYDAFDESELEGLDRNTDIVVYCSVGYRSERIGEKLLKMGFTNVRNLYGGIFDWVNQGNPVVNNAGVKTDSVHTYNRDWSRWLTRGVKVY